MSKHKITLTLITVFLSVLATHAVGQTVVPATDEQVDKLIAVLKSDAEIKEKYDACRLLSIVATKKAVPTLASLLDDEKMSHMARYALEPIDDPSVDDALRDALGKAKGRPLIGVIGSLGVRRDAKAVAPLKEMLMRHDSGPDVTSAAVRALGSIGTPAAAQTLRTALAHAPEEGQLAVCEGLMRCAEALAVEGHRDIAIEIYDELRDTKGPHQVRGGAMRGAILTRRPKDGTSLIKQILTSDDYIMFSAACQAALEMPDEAVTDALTSQLDKLPEDNKILVIQTLGKRGDAKALPTLAGLARNAAKPVRIAAIRAMPQIPKATGLALVGLFDDDDREISETARENFAAIHNPAVDDVVSKMFAGNDTAKRLTALDLMGRRRMADKLPDIRRAMRDKDDQVRPAAIRKVGELGGPGELSALLDILTTLTDSRDLEAARQSIGSVCAKAENPESFAGRLADLAQKAGPQQKIVLLRVLSGIGGATALKTVRAAVDDSDSAVHAAAIRALGTWNTADAAPQLLELAKNSSEQSDRTLCLRGYLGMASRPNIPAEQRLEMCRLATPTVRSDDEKKLLLAALGRIDSVDAIAMILPYLDSASTKAEAATASLGIVERLLTGRGSARLAPRLVTPLENVIKAEVDSGLTERANNLLQQVRERVGDRRSNR